MKLHEQAGILSGAIMTLVMVAGAVFWTPVLATGTGEAEIRTVEPSRDWLGGIPEAPTEDWEVAFGGRLYDNWARAALTVGPEDTHPSYPPWGKKKGYTTWRCKECHGWDYRGRDGVYAQGSHYTGIKGLRELVAKAPEIVERTIRDDIHGYTTDQISVESAKRCGNNGATAARVLRIPAAIPKGMPRPRTS